MIRFAVIGTNWITRQFVDAAHETGKYKLTAVYSRSLEQAQTFANDYPVEHLFTSLEAMAQSEAIDAVYIASPNSLHFPQTELFCGTKSMLFAKSHWPPTWRKPKPLSPARVKTGSCCLKRLKPPACLTSCCYSNRSQKLEKSGRHLSITASTPRVTSAIWMVKIRTRLIRRSPMARLWISVLLPGLGGCAVGRTTERSGQRQPAGKRRGCSRCGGAELR